LIHAIALSGKVLCHVVTFLGAFKRLHGHGVAEELGRLLAGFASKPFLFKWNPYIDFDRQVCDLLQ
jgi:hypothetical protein